MEPITATDLNLIVLRYLMESGFMHSAFSFQYEAQVHNNNTLELISNGAMVNLVQKGLQYLELEANLDDEGDFSFLKPLELISKSPNELRQIIKERRRKLQEDDDKEKREKGQEHDMQVDGKGPGEKDAAASDVVKLEGHTDEVFSCAWSPAGSVFASGSGDATVRIWSIGNDTDGSRAHSKLPNVRVLTHSTGVLTVDWNGQGTLLATGSFGGLATIWTAGGEFKVIFNQRLKPINSVKWNKSGDYILTACADKTVMVWDVKAVAGKQQFLFPAGVLDVDWCTDLVFATYSMDKMIYVCEVGVSQPIKAFAGHEGEVNCIKWDPSAQFLASCSDDHTVKVWSANSDNCIRDLREHAKQVYDIKWSPTVQGLLASASGDSTVKLWDIQQHRCLITLNGHRDAASGIAFSPNGQYLASGSTDKSVLVWSVKEGTIVKAYRDVGGIQDICWNMEGDKIAASCDNHSVLVMDFRM